MPSVRSAVPAFAFAALLPLAALSCHGSASPIPDALANEPPRASGPRVAVVELFTSEGCSSCPPAEAVFERVVSQARAAGDRVVPLAFHVDYWDDLGWPDRFASPDFTARQRDYTRAFGDSGMYTPEMIVGGGDHFVGSDASRAAAAIASALARPSAVHPTVHVTRKAPDSIAVHVDVDGDASGADGAELWIGVVQRSATVHVERGENAGRTLRHTDVVRAFVESALRGGTGDAVVHLPWVPAAHEADVVALVQRREGRSARAVLGADAAEVP